MENKIKTIFPIAEDFNGLTKLEYFSIECLKRVVDSTYISNEIYIKKLVKGSINTAKELLKQLEDESNN